MQLEQRVSKGFDLLANRELVGDTGPEWERWFKAWEVLLAEYEMALDRAGKVRA